MQGKVQAPYSNLYTIKKIGNGKWKKSNFDSDNVARLSVPFYSGDGKDKGLSYHNGQKFSTYDFDQDIHRGNCAAANHGAWWYRKCYKVNLNGAYSKHLWYGALKGQKRLKVTRMMFRRVWIHDVLFLFIKNMFI